MLHYFIQIKNKMKKNIFYILFILYILSSCNPHKETVTFKGKTEIILIDKLIRHSDVNEIIPDEFIVEKRYIKLVSRHDDFLFKEINKIRIVNDHIFILDGRLGKLLVFDMNGTSKAKIGMKGNGPNEYIDIADFDVDSEGFIYTIDGRLDKLFVYNPDYSLNSVRLLPFEVDVFSITEDNNIMFGLSAWNKGENEGASIVIADKNLKTLEVVAYFDEFVDNAFWVSHYSFVKTNNHIVYNKPINNDVLIFTKKGLLENVLEFDFGRKNVPLKERKDVERYLQNYSSYNLLKWITIVHDNYIIGNFWENRETKSFFINRAKNEIFVSKSTIDRDIGNVAGFDETSLIKFIIPGLDRSKDETLPQDVVDHLDNGDFVLCIYDLK